MTPHFTLAEAPKSSAATQREIVRAIDAGEFDDSMLQSGWPA